MIRFTDYKDYDYDYTKFFAIPENIVWRVQGTSSQYSSISSSHRRNYSGVRSLLDEKDKEEIMSYIDYSRVNENNY